MLAMLIVSPDCANATNFRATNNPALSKYPLPVGSDRSHICVKWNTNAVKIENLISKTHFQLTNSFNPFGQSSLIWLICSVVFDSVGPVLFALASVSLRNRFAFIFTSISIFFLCSHWNFAAVYASVYSNYMFWRVRITKIDNGTRHAFRRRRRAMKINVFRWNDGFYLLDSKRHRLIRTFWGISQPQRLQLYQYPLDRLVCSTLRIWDCVCQQPKYDFACTHRERARERNVHIDRERVRKPQLLAFVCTNQDDDGSRRMDERKRPKKLIHFKSIIHLAQKVVRNTKRSSNDNNVRTVGNPRRLISVYRFKECSSCVSHQ